MSDFEVIAGIDLGTTNSAIGILDNGLPRLIEIDGRPTMPSCVGIGPDGEVLVGQPALNQLAAAPERTVASIKRHMGSELPLLMADKHYRPEELSAFILKRLKQEAERALGQERRHRDPSRMLRPPRRHPLLPGRLIRILAHE